MKKNFVYLTGLLLVSILFSGCETKAYFIERETKINHVEKDTKEYSTNRETKALLAEKKNSTLKSITFNADTLFELNSSYMKKEDLHILNELAKEIKNNKSKIAKIEIIGHSDMIGQDENYNQWLSERRANRVAFYLQSQGVSSDIDIFGAGSREPIVHCDQNNRTELIMCLSPNRRVEVKFINKNRLM